jgi:hypothetical protein
MLDLGLRSQQRAKQEQNAPILEQVKAIEEQVTSCQLQQEQLLDLYLNDRIPMMSGTKRNMQLPVTLTTRLQLY